MHGRRRTKDERKVDTIVEGVDITRQPSNRFYYEHIIDPTDEEDSVYNDFHVRNQLLAQYKYSTEKSKTVTFFVITLVSYALVFPVFVIHYTRTYRNINSGVTDDYDNADAVGRGVYTAFVWISYALLVVKSFVCLVQNRFYRHALYQSANCRGFTGMHDFQREIKMIVKKIDDAI